MRLKNDIHASTYIRGYPMLTLYIADAERDVGMKNLSQKEAEKVLEGMKVKIEIPKAAVTQWKRNTALDMAIEALNYSEIPNSSGCISRQAVDELSRELVHTTRDKADFLCKFWEGLGKLPPVTPQPKTGRWIAYEVRLPYRTILNYRCSVCGRQLIGYSTKTLSEAPFCHCGAKMQEEEE